MYASLPSRRTEHQDRQTDNGQLRLSETYNMVRATHNTFEHPRFGTGHIILCKLRSLFKKKNDESMSVLSEICIGREGTWEGEGGREVVRSRVRDVIYL